MEAWEKAYIVETPEKARGRPAKFAATRWQVFCLRLLEWFGVLLKWLRVPGFIRGAQIEDQVSGQRLQIRVGSLFTRISINDRDYYFRRLSGKFDGTGSGL
jgi:hypothetical protein